MAFFTVGHSSRSLEDFLALLEAHRIEEVVDVRRFPGSRKHPHFGQEALASSLRERGIGYRHEPEFGGRRRPDPESPNDAWRNASFRAYADHMGSDAFRAALDRLERRAAQRRTALLCAEAVHWRCHRRLIADALVLRGHPVCHVLDPGRAVEHALHPDAVPTTEGVPRYPAEK